MAADAKVRQPAGADRLVDPGRPHREEGGRLRRPQQRLVQADHWRQLQLLATSFQPRHVRHIHLVAQPASSPPPNRTESQPAPVSYKRPGQADSCTAGAPSTRIHDGGISSTGATGRVWDDDSDGGRRASGLRCGRWNFGRRSVCELYQAARAATSGAVVDRGVSVAVRAWRRGRARRRWRAWRGRGSR